MPIVSVDEACRAGIERLGQMPAGVPREIVRVSVAFLRKGASRRVVEKAAARLSAPPAEVEAVVAAAAHFVAECARVDATERDVADSVALLPLPSPQCEAAAALTDAAIVARAEVRALLARSAPLALPHYADLSWRLDAEVGTRCLRGQATPTFVLRLATETAQGRRRQQLPRREETLLEADPVSLRHVAAELEIALAQVKTAASRRVMRNVH